MPRHDPGSGSRVRHGTCRMAGGALLVFSPAICRPSTSVARRGEGADTHQWCPPVGTMPSHHDLALTSVFVVCTPFSIDDAFTDHGGCSGTLRGTSSRNRIPPNELPGAHVNDRRRSPLHRGWRLRNASKIRPPVVRMSARTHWAIVHVKRSRPRMETVRDDQPVTGYGPADR